MSRVDGAARLPELNAHREGTGATLVLLPGLASTIREFGTVQPELARRYEVLALDLPGQGGSPALPAPLRPDVGALTDAVEREFDRHGISAPHVLGVSLGGRIALELARRHRAASVVAIGPTGPVPHRSGRTRRPCSSAHDCSPAPWPRWPARCCASPSRARPPSKHLRRCP